MIQDIAPHQLDNQFRNQEPVESDYALVFKDNKLLLKGEEKNWELLTFEELAKIDDHIYEKAEYGFSIDETGYFLIGEFDLPENCEYQFWGTQVFREMKPRYQAFAGITASQIHRWREGRKFCGCCGSPMKNSETERAMICTRCGVIEYPKISPAVIIAITNGDKLLMSRYADRPYRGYALIAGFVEVGETFEETVSREVMEEVGLKVKNIRYHKSQPWSFTDTIMIGYFAELDGDDTITLMDGELSEAGWYTRDEILDDADPVSVGSELKMIFKYGEDWKKYVKHNPVE